MTRKGFYFEHVERRSCFSVTRADLTAAAEGAEGELAEEKAAAVVVHLMKQTGSKRALLSTCEICVLRRETAGQRVACHADLLHVKLLCR